jgi:hypothetical protein
MKNLRIILGFCLFSTVFGCQSGTTASPDHLVGVWRTTASEYTGRFLTLTKEDITFGTGGDTSVSYPITNVAEEREGAYILYTISYFDAEQESRLSFYYNAEDGGLITFKGQPHLRWTKDRG